MMAKRKKKKKTYYASAVNENIFHNSYKISSSHICRREDIIGSPLDEIKVLYCTTLNFLRYEIYTHRKRNLLLCSIGKYHTQPTAMWGE